MKAVSYLIVVLTMCAALYFGYNNKKRISDYKSEIEKIKVDLESQRKLQLEQEERELISRIKIEKILNSSKINNSSLFNDTLVYLYIPHSVCNDCMVSAYGVLRKAKQENKIHFAVLSPKITYRENLSFFSNYGFDILMFDLLYKEPLDNIFLFKYQNHATNIIVVHKNETEKCRAYLKGLLN